MNNEAIMITDALDIIFEKRNKAYGAYTLRKFYNARLSRSLGAMIAIVVLFSAFSLMPDRSASPVDFIVKDQVFGQAPAPPKAPEVKPQPKKINPVPPKSAVKFISNIILVDQKEAGDSIRDLNERAIAGKTAMVLNESAAELAIPVFAGDEKGSVQAKATEQKADILNPTDNPEIMPAYPGGMEALRRFLLRNLSNPRDLEEGELITVKVKFVVGYDGALQRFELVQDGGTEFNNEVIRVLKKMPAWIPGKSKGQNVPVFYTIPVKFIREG